MAKTAGTYHFFPPECCDPDVDQYSGRSADIWALGATLFCLIFNELPFWDQENCENEYSIIEYILKTDI
jgi:serine/threonine protein kinase